MDDEDLVLAASSTTRSKKPVRDDRAGRVVRVVDEEQPRRLELLGRDRVEVGGEAELGRSGSRYGLGAGQHRASGVDRVAGVGGQGDVARVEEGEAEVVDALLGPDRGDDLVDRVDLDSEALQVEVGERLRNSGAAAIATDTSASQGSATASRIASTT